MVPKVMIILGSASDIEIAKKAMCLLEELEIRYSLKIASAHRTHYLVKNLVIQGTKEGVEVFIGIAGLAAHLPGTIAAYTHRPVIGVPVDVKLDGLDALCASVQMPYPAPVATVGIDRGDNAAILAGQIIGINDENIRNNISKVRRSYRKQVIKSEIEALKTIEGKFIDKRFLSDSCLETEEDHKDVKKSETKSDVSIIVGSYSDMLTAKKVIVILDKLKINYNMKVLSPIRHAQKFEKHIKSMEDVKMFIGINGLSSQITGALVGLSEKPIIGVPCTKNTHIDALISMVNMPPGVPVGTVGLDNGRNGGILAGEIMGLFNSDVETILLKTKYKKSNI